LWIYIWIDIHKNNWYIICSGDPTVYERYWRQTGDKTTIIIHGWQSMSYFSDVSNICWFLEPEFAKEVVRLHRLVGNAVTDGRHIVVGTGSSQLFLAALYALSPSHSSQPINVVCATPYYSVSILSFFLFLINCSLVLKMF
jgi:L-tryptophan--pyruvate aminotransferase